MLNADGAGSLASKLHHRKTIGVPTNNLARDYPRPFSLYPSRTVIQAVPKKGRRPSDQYREVSEGGNCGRTNDSAATAKCEVNDALLPVPCRNENRVENGLATDG
jgi:hypothetical protein